MAAVFSTVDSESTKPHASGASRELAPAARTDVLASLAVAHLRMRDGVPAVAACAAARELDPYEVLRPAVKAHQQLGDEAAVREAKLALRAARTAAPSPREAWLVPAAPLEPPGTYTGRSAQTNARAIESQMDALQDELGPKLQRLIEGVERWAAKLEHEPMPFALPQMSELLAPSAEQPQLAVCISFEGVALELEAGGGLNDALVRTCVDRPAPDSPLAPDEPEEDEAREAETRGLAADALRTSVADTVDAMSSQSGVRLSEPFAEWCESASMAQWHVCVLSASFKPAVRHFLRAAGLSQITAVAADAICRRESNRWEATSWGAVDRIRALRGWLSSTLGLRTAARTAQLVLVGAHARDALLLRAEPPLVHTLYVLHGSGLERWCDAHDVRYRRFIGFDALRADLEGVQC
jgi:hypothetical protein